MVDVIAIDQLAEELLGDFLEAQAALAFVALLCRALLHDLVQQLELVARQIARVLLKATDLVLGH